MNVYEILFSYEGWKNKGFEFLKKNFLIFSLARLYIFFYIFLKECLIRDGKFFIDTILCMCQTIVRSDIFIRFSLWDFLEIRFYTFKKWLKRNAIRNGFDSFLDRIQRNSWVNCIYWNLEQDIRDTWKTFHGLNKAIWFHINVGFKNSFQRADFPFRRIETSQWSKSKRKKWDFFLLVWSRSNMSYLYKWCIECILWMIATDANIDHKIYLSMLR